MKRGVARVASPELLARRVDEFYEELKKVPCDRYRSWEHCYEAFAKTKGRDALKISTLSLHLAFYLASWGMYRGSSFLLQRDYHVHDEAVRIILKYEALRGIACGELLNRIDLLFKLSDELVEHYRSIRQSVEDQRNEMDRGKRHGKTRSDISQTLITKILMGTLGCCPAYDRYFIQGIGEQRDISKTFSRESIKALATYYLRNQNVFDRIRRKTDGGLRYPQMKILDMAFWKQGYHLENG